MAEYAIEASGLRKSFGACLAVDGIGLSVRRGEMFGIIGPDGAGKTTAMRMLCGLSRPTEGEGSVAGYDIRHKPEQIKRHIGYMSQRFSLYEDLTVAENIRLFAGIYRVPRKEIGPRMESLLASLDMTGLKDRLVRDIPQGWKQKLAFSVSILRPR